MVSLKWLCWLCWFWLLCMRYGDSSAHKREFCFYEQRNHKHLWTTEVVKVPYSFIYWWKLFWGEKVQIWSGIWCVKCFFNSYICLICSWCSSALIAALYTFICCRRSFLYVYSLLSWHKLACHPIAEILQIRLYNFLCGSEVMYLSALYLYSEGNDWPCEHWLTERQNSCVEHVDG